jgi:hypothetical protein
VSIDPCHNNQPVFGDRSHDFKYGSGGVHVCKRCGGTLEIIDNRATFRPAIVWEPKS